MVYKSHQVAMEKILDEWAFE